MRRSLVFAAGMLALSAAALRVLHITDVETAIWGLFAAAAALVGVAWAAHVFKERRRET